MKKVLTQHSQSGSLLKTVTNPPEMNPPSISSFHPSSLNEDTCVGRRIGEPDRRWKPFVFHATQCKNKPLDGLTLCGKCERRRTTATGARWYAGYLGAVTEMDLPANCHIAGSHWFFRMVRNGKLTFNDHVIVPVDPEHLLSPEEEANARILQLESQVQESQNRIATLTSDLEEARATAIARRKAILDALGLQLV